MLELQEALERAKLLSNDSMHLSEQSYELLVDKLAEEDLYPFTIGLVERGILVRQSNVKRTDASIEDKLVKAAQYKQSPGGVWMPDNYDDETEIEDADLEEVQDGEYESYMEGGTPFVWPNSQPYTGDDVTELKNTLENAGIRITPEGTVEMYSANIPGIYTDKLPQGPLPLEIAVKYFDQLLDASDTEQTKLSGLLDVLTRLSNSTSEVEASIEELDNYNYSAASRSESSQAIANGLQEVRSLLAEGNWTAAQRVLGDLKGNIDEYSGERLGVYDGNLAVLDALDKLTDLQAADPDGYQQAIQGLGGMPLAARRRAYDSPEDFYDHSDDIDWRSDATDLEFSISDGYLQTILDEVADVIVKEGLDPVSIDMQGAKQLIERGLPSMVGDSNNRFGTNVGLTWTADDQIQAKVEAVFQGKHRPATMEEPEEWDDIFETYDLSDDQWLLEQLVDIIFEGVG